MDENEQAKAVAAQMNEPKTGQSGRMDLLTLLAWIRRHGLRVRRFDGFTVFVEKEKSAMLETAEQLSKIGNQEN